MDTDTFIIPISPRGKQPFLPLIATTEVQIWAWSPHSNVIVPPSEFAGWWIGEIWITKDYHLEDCYFCYLVSLKLPLKQELPSLFSLRNYLWWWISCPTTFFPASCQHFNCWEGLRPLYLNCSQLEGEVAVSGQNAFNFVLFCFFNSFSIQVLTRENIYI